DLRIDDVDLSGELSRAGQPERRSRSQLLEVRCRARHFQMRRSAAKVFERRGQFDSPAKMRLVPALKNVARLQNRRAVCRGNMKDTAVGRGSSLLEVADLRNQFPLPCARRTDQTTKIDIQLFYLAANEVFRKRRIFIDDTDGNVLGVQMEIGIER